MANIASQEKRIHRAERERVENRRRTSQVKTWFRRLESAVDDGDAARADEELRSLVSRIDKAVEVGRPAPQQRRPQEVPRGPHARPPLLDSLETRLLIRGELVRARAARWRSRSRPRGEASPPSRCPPRSRSTRRSAPRAEASRGWAAMPAGERAELLHEVATRLRASTDELAEPMTREGGKPLVENADEVGWIAAAFDYYAEMGRNFAGRVIPPIEASQLALVLKEPIGVVACIVPWNYPLLLLAWKLAPALAAGNACVCKPSELTPLSTLALAPCFEHLPPGVVNILPGGGDVGARIVADPRVDCVAFTGSVETGKRIAALCADARRARSTSSSAARTRSSSAPTSAGEIEIAARGGAWAAYLNAGQVCTSAERFYVMRRRLRRLRRRVRRPRALAARRRPADADTDMGPMVCAAQREKVEAQLEAAVGAGAEVVLRRRPRRPRPGTSSRPRSSPARPRETDLLREETFGPVAPIVPVARSTRRSSSPTPRASGSAPTSTPATCDRSCAACARSRPARSGSTTR